MSKLDKLKKKAANKNAFAGVEKAEAKFRQTDDFIKSKIQIHEDFRDLIAPLTPEEYEQLEKNIVEEGCRDPLVLWKQPDSSIYYLIDGHNRYKVCTAHSVDFKIVVKEFEQMSAAKDWMIENQLGRRNLTREQASYLRGLRYNSQTKDRTANLKQFQPKGQNVSSVNVAEEMAKTYGVSKKTLQRDGKFAKGLEVIGEESKELKKDILKAKVKVAKADVESLASLPKEQVQDKVQEIKSQSRGLGKKTNTASREVKKTTSSGLTIDQLPVYLNKLLTKNQQIVAGQKEDSAYYEAIGVVKTCEDLLKKLQ